MAGRAAGGNLCRNAKLYCDRKARQLDSAQAGVHGLAGRYGEGRVGDRRAGGRPEGCARQGAAAGAGACGASWARLAGWQERGLGAGRAGWPWAVHSVHSAYFSIRFDSVLFMSQFLDIVREPGS